MNEEDKSTAGLDPSRPDEFEALSAIIATLRRFDKSDQQRIIHSVSVFLELNDHQGIYGRQTRSVGSEKHSASFSEDRSPSPKDFLSEKQPKSDVQRVACLAYYLTHYRNSPHFKTLDISKLNTEAAQPKFSNAAKAVDNANQSGYLVPATKGNKQLSAIGERFVQALPDQDAARAVAAAGRPRKKSRRTALKKDEGLSNGEEK